MITIVIATPHARYDALEQRIRRELPDVDVVRIRDHRDMDAGKLNGLQPTWVFFPHWSQRIPPEVHQGFRCVIFHMTDVPYGRGGSPLQNLVVRGHRDTMLSALRCQEEMDAGPVYLKRPLALDGTAEQILGRAAELMAAMIVDLVRTSPEPVAQQGEAVVFRRRGPADGDLSGLEELAQVYDYIRMLDGEGYPRAFIEHGAFRLEFSNAELQPDAVRAQVVIRKK